MWWQSLVFSWLAGVWQGLIQSILGADEVAVRQKLLAICDWLAKMTAATAGLFDDWAVALVAKALRDDETWALVMQLWQLVRGEHVVLGSNGRLVGAAEMYPTAELIAARVGDEKSGAIDPATILALIQMIAGVLDMWRKRRGQQ